MNLLKYRRDKYSQFGEDGIVEQLIQDIGLRLSEGLCVEFGAWDGIKFSNTRKLIEQGWEAILIEADRGRFDELLDNYPSKLFPRTVPINRKVGIDSENEETLEQILFPLFDIYVNGIDFMVIDVDGDEYHIWKSMKLYQPKIMMVECNPTFPMNMKFVQKYGNRIGSSALSLYLLGIEKGYTLVCFNRVNLIFVRNDVFPSAYELLPFYKLYILGSAEYLHVSKDYDGKLYQYGLWDEHKSNLHSIDALKNLSDEFEIVTGEEFLELCVKKRKRKMKMS